MWRLCLVALAFSSAAALQSPITTRLKAITRLQASVDVLETASSHFQLHGTTLLTSLLRQTSKSESEASFWFFFLAGSGALGIGLGQVPKIKAEFDEIAALKGLGGTKGGEALNLGPVGGFGLPEELRKADIEDILANIPSVEKISSKGQKKTFLEQQGYLSRQGFRDSYPAETNQVALYAVFSALAGGGSSFVVAPSAFQALSQKWKAEGVESFVSDLNKSQIGKLSGYGGLAFLVLLVIDLVVETGSNAFL
jgi:hypothetical protein